MTDFLPYYTCVFRRGDNVYIREVQEDGSRQNLKIKYQPTLYFVDEDSDGEFKNLRGEKLKGYTFQTISSAKDYASATDKTVYGYNRWEYACLQQRYPYEIKFDFEKLKIVYLDIETESGTHYSSVSNPDQPIILIQILYRNIFYIFGTEHYESYDDKVKYIKCKDELDMFKKFVALFNKIDPDIISGYHSQSYDIPMLWARMNYIEQGALFKKLSPFNMIDEYEEEVYSKMEKRITIHGVQHLDIMDLVRKFDNKKYENYKLDTVAIGILGRGKVKYDGDLALLYRTDFPKFLEYGKVDVELLRDIEEKKHFISMVVGAGYMSKSNYDDTFSQVRSWDNALHDELVNDGIQPPFLIARDSTNKDGDEFEEEDDKKFEGAFVFQPTPNKYEWVMSDDVQSMHPSIIMAMNVSPETFVMNTKKSVDFFLKEDTTEYNKWLKNNNYTSMANGAVFTREFEGFVPRAIRKVFDKRVEAKAEASKHAKLAEKYKLDGDNENEKYHRNQYVIFNTLQNALKVKINSLFGFLGNKFSRYYQIDLAEGITLTSQLVLKNGADEVSKLISGYTGCKYEDVLLYGDTDSLFFSVKPIVDKFLKGKSKEEIVDKLDKFHDAKIEPQLKIRIDTLQDSMNCIVKQIKFVRDVISDTSILIAKKKYIMSVWDAEKKRYSEPELKMMGIEAVKTSTPMFCRNAIKQSVIEILYKTEEEFQNYIAETKKKFMKLPVEEISFPKKITDINKYVDSDKTVSVFDDWEDDEDGYKKGAPIHVKGSIFYNNLLERYKLTNKMMKIENGDAIKYVYLKEPNPIGNNTIAYMDNLPKEFGLHKYVNYDIQWEKTFWNPVNQIAEIIGWKMENDYGLF